MVLAGPLRLLVLPAGLLLLPSPVATAAPVDDGVVEAPSFLWCVEGAGLRGGCINPASDPTAVAVAGTPAVAIGWAAVVVGGVAAPVAVAAADCWGANPGVPVVPFPMPVLLTGMPPVTQRIDGHVNTCDDGPAGPISRIYVMFKGVRRQVVREQGNKVIKQRKRTSRCRMVHVRIWITGGRRHAGRRCCCCYCRRRRTLRRRTRTGHT